MTVVGVQFNHHVKRVRRQVLSPDATRATFIRLVRDDGRVMDRVPGKGWDRVFQQMGNQVESFNQTASSPMSIPSLIRSALEAYPKDVCLRKWNREYPPPTVTLGKGAIRRYLAWKNGRDLNSAASVKSQVEAGIYALGEISEELDLSIPELVLMFGDVVSPWVLCLDEEIVQWAAENQTSYLASDIVACHFRYRNDDRLRKAVYAILRDRVGDITGEEGE